MFGKIRSIVFMAVAAVVASGCGNQKDSAQHDDGHALEDAGLDTPTAHDATSNPDTPQTADTGHDTAAPDTGPCGQSCAEPTPMCDEHSGECVACMQDAGCGADSHCDPDTHECVECYQNDQCGAVCDTSTNTCVECLGDGDCTDGKVCETSDNTCVECLADSDCTDATKARCDTATNTCKPCTDSTQCAGVAGAGICDADSGQCVECTVDDESACNGKSCDPATNTCTQTDLDSVDACGQCKADSECHAGYRCIPMKFQGTDLPDGYCLKTVASGCNQPFTGIVDRASLSGAPADQYCGVVESKTTCKAVLDMINSVECPNGTDDECGLPGMSDGQCKTVNGLSNRCSYSCSGNGFCPSGFACGGATAGDGFCGG